VTAVAFGPDLVASGDADGNVILWDVTTGTEKEKLIDVVQFNIPNKAPTDWLAFNTDGTWLYVINMERSAIHACRLDPNNRLFPGFGGSGQLRMLGFSPGGEYYFHTSGERKTVAFFDNEFPDNRISGMVVAQMRHEEEVILAAVSADSKTAVTVGDKGTIYGWALDAGDATQRWAVASGKTEDVTALVLSADGKRVAVAGKDGTVRVLDVKTGKGPMQTRRHDGAVHGVSFSPDGRWLATAGEDKTVRVWDAETGKELATLKGHTGAVKGVAFGPDGTMLATASEDKTVKVWEYKK
jgi:WD40 repeat protein